MTAFCLNFRLLRAATAAAGVLALLGFGLAQPALAAPPRYADILPLSKVKPGMIGYGLTTFKGTTISKFKVTVIGILPRQNEGHDLILVRMAGGPITQRGANLIQGMSGSPIYLNGKVAGAFSMGEQFPREPIGMVTPIEDMLEAWDPNIPQQPNYYMPADKLPLPSTGNGGITRRTTGLFGQPTQENRRPSVITLPQPITVGGRHISRLVLNAGAGESRRSDNTTAVLYRATSLLCVSGINERDRQWLQKELDQRGYALTVTGAPGRGAAGAARGKGFGGATLRPGSAFGTWLATGDVEVGGTGTVTYRRGNRFLGFGHPLFGLGPLNAAVSSAYILDIFPGIGVSHHIAVPGPIIGTLRQDRDFSVSAELGVMPALVPIEVTVRDHTTLRTQTFHARVFQNPDLTPLLLRLVAKDVIGEAHSTPGDVMARVTTTVEAGEVGKVTRTNVAFDSQDIATIATSDLTDITNVVSGNPFYPLPIKSVQMTVDITSGHNTATVERIFLKQGRYEPGDTLDIGVVLKPYRRNSIVRNIALKIPSDTPSGRYALLVRGGTAQTMRIGSFVISGGSQDPQTPPVNIRQMITRLDQHEQNTDLVARLILNTVAPALEGEKLSQLPPNLATLMRSDRNSGVRLERDELRTVVPAQYVISGSQQLVVTVQRKNSIEPTGNGNFGGSPPSLSPGGISPFQSAGGNGLTGASVSDEDTPGGEPVGQSARWGLAPRRLSRPGRTDGDDPAGVTTEPPATSEPASEGPAEGEEDTDDQQTKPDPLKGKQARPAKSGNTAGSTAQAPTETNAESAQLSQASAGASASSDTSNDRPVGRQLQVWRQSAGQDFASGKFNGATVSAGGELRLAPRLRLLTSSGETYIWSLATDSQGNLYAGTGTGGKILKVNPDGQLTPFASLPVISVQSLLMGRDGSLWAGSGVKGNVYRVRPDGTFTLFTVLPEKYVLALAEDSRGNLFIAPGGGGTIYRVRTDGNSPAPVKPEAYLKTNADHVMALAVDGHDNLYAGTGNDGILYKVTPDGKSSVLYDAKENSITALATDGQGNVYAGTGPKGLLYRITPDGVATVIYDRATAFYTGLRTAPDGTLYASTVNAVYHILPASDRSLPYVVQPLDNPTDVDFLTLDVLPKGGVVAGTGNVGEIYTSLTDSKVSQGTFESVSHDARTISRWGVLHIDTLNSSGPSAGQIRAETRSGNVAEPDSTWSNWQPVPLHGAVNLYGQIASPAARFIQYRLILEGSSAEGAQSATSLSSGTTMQSGAPLAVRGVSVSYMPRNQPPRVSFQSPAGGERWSKSQTLRWNGSDPDNDTLSYDLYLSSDGVNWRPLPIAGKLPTGSMPTFDPQKRADSQATMPDSLKGLIARSEAQSGNRMMATGQIGALRATSKSWDTSSVPDGVYRLKVIATDRISNPVDALTAEAISEPFVVCNTPPSLNLTPQPVIGADRTVTLSGAATQTLIAVTAVQYRVDGGDWVAAVPRDGLFDSPQESFSFSTLPLTSGKHTIEVAAFNAAGSKSMQKVDVTVP